MLESQTSHFKAIIVGGSVTGLTLAHAFDTAGIDYVLLEGRDHVAPAAGATIVIMPNGARILDQLGIYEQMKLIFEPMVASTIWRSDGKLMSRVEWPKIIHERFGYPAAMFERQKFLQSLYDQLGSKERILVNKRVVMVNHRSDSVSVLCADGSEYVGDIVVGADGIHSIVRQEMQRYAEQVSPGLMRQDKECITAEYNCIFGVSSPMPFHLPGHVHISSAIDHSSLLFVGKDSLPQWFFVQRMDQKYLGSHIPRFTQAQMQAQVQKFKDFKFAKGVSFKDLLGSTGTMSYVVAEEAVHDFWTHGRIVCIGDSVHKMTPNLGQGGNQSIESVAVLTNALFELLGRNERPHPPISDLEIAFLKYQNKRKARAARFVEISGKLTRYEALATPSIAHRFLHSELLTTSTLADLQTAWYRGAPKLGHLSLPKHQEGITAWKEDSIVPGLRTTIAQSVKSLILDSKILTFIDFNNPYKNNVA
ncbi:hypothetical protein F5884DRAFT_879800 [Xylogone sp. PMI_703]|nr:hypothetical protein F5884DRAFT_879800 [Xylogone sp. PMI_703]